MMNFFRRKLPNLEFMVEIPMDELVILVGMVDKAVAVITDLKAKIDGHIMDAAAVSAQKDSDAAVADTLKAANAATFKAMADKLTAVLPA